MHKLAGDRYILTFYECTKIKEINEILRNFANRKLKKISVLYKPYSLGSGGLVAGWALGRYPACPTSLELLQEQNPVKGGP